jgi:subtilase family serine protease
MRAAYAPGVTLDGSGQVVGLIELGPYNLQDVQSYFSTIGEPLQVPIYNVLLGVDGICSGTPGNGGCDDGEEVIDIEQAISMAPHLSGLIVYEAYGSNSDALTAFTQAASDNIAKQMSLSFGWGGTPGTEPGYEQVFLEFQAQGQNLFIASGDSGANVGGGGYPGNSPTSPWRPIPITSFAPMARAREGLAVRVSRPRVGRDSWRWPTSRLTATPSDFSTPLCMRSGSNRATTCSSTI